MFFIVPRHNMTGHKQLWGRFLLESGVGDYSEHQADADEHHSDRDIASQDREQPSQTKQESCNSKTSHNFSFRIGLKCVVAASQL